MKLFPPQEEIIKRGLLDRKEHCFICMPTGTGKTYLAEYSIDKVLESGFKAIYVTPLRALATEQWNHFKNRFSDASVGIFTGETIQKSHTNNSYCNAHLLIMTPERLDACMRNWRSHWSWIPDVDLIVIDEFHILGQVGRGSRLEGTLTRFIRLNPFVRIMGLSATMPNTKELSDWLRGVSFVSQWRRVPLEKKVVRFKSAKEKPELLLSEVRKCIDCGGQSLIFCNSRSRVQALVQFLNQNGIESGCHHAGLLSEKRSEIESRFRSGEIRALVATSTLEMGMNLPARQVVIYDSYSFSDTGFEPLPVWNFIQRAGRAGRPGLDENGEAILMLPRWAGESSKYLNGKCENVNSALISTKAMQEQILIDVFGGYSRTREELSNGFLPLTLYKKQHPEAAINGAINKLIMTDLLIEHNEDDQESNMRTLRCGLLGRLSVKLMLSPETVKLIKDVYEKEKRLYLFDILLIVTLSEDCSPVLATNYEELDTLCECVQCLHSSLLDLSMEQVKKTSLAAPGTMRILAGIKMAAICHMLTTGIDAERIADIFDVYPADIRMLQENVVRLLIAMNAIISAIDKGRLEGEAIEKKRQEALYVPNLCSLLTNMLKYGIDGRHVSLTRLKGVGGKTAKRLADAGYSSIQDIAVADASKLAAIPGIGEKLASEFVSQASVLIQNGEDNLYEETDYDYKGKTRNVKTVIDPYRLRRSLELSIKGRDGFKFLVAGGREDHMVHKKAGVFVCDCMDFDKNGNNCKHILCVRNALNDPEVCQMVKRIKEDRYHSIRESLPSLWYSTKGRGDENNG